jgi:hypothetical protein
VQLPSQLLEDLRLDALAKMVAVVTKLVCGIGSSSGEVSPSAASSAEEPLGGVWQLITLEFRQSNPLQLRPHKAIRGIDARQRVRRVDGPRPDTTQSEQRRYVYSRRDRQTGAQHPFEVPRQLIKVGRLACRHMRRSVACI